jgi:3-isopropylmalate/(R)-2-methylmalate dehydratase large subunit
MKLSGPILALTEDPGLITAQLGPAAALSPADLAGLIREPLLDNVSTDEIIPAWCCYWYDDRLGDYAYLGLRDAAPDEGAVRALGPQVIVSGHAKGCGSSREHAVYAEQYAGVQIVFARSFERIYRQNCRNVGILTSEDFDLLDALLSGEEVGLDAFTGPAGGIERSVIALGGLFGYHRAGAPAEPAFDGPRPLNYVEKIIQSRLAHRRPEGATVKVGESYFVEADVRFSHEYVTPMAAEMFTRQFGADAAVADPASCWFFQDHLSLAPTVLTRRRNGDELIVKVENLDARQLEFATRSGGHFIGPEPTGGSRAICHAYLVENVARPGEIVVGTDSHTCTSGAVGAFAFGVGATDIAAAWYNRQVLVTVPEVVTVNLTGRLGDGVCAKDVVLTLLTHPGITGRQTIGRVLLFAGSGLADLDIDERTTLCNMAVEAGATTAVVEPDSVTDRFLKRRGFRPYQAEPGDDGATYAGVVDVDLAAVEPMVSLPGDPRNAVPLRSIGETVAVDRAYGGSCAGGKARDMDLYASVFALAKAHGVKVCVPTYVQMGSDSVLAYAIELGYVQLFEDVGVSVLPSSCDACIDAGPGVSEGPDEVTVSAQNRNFPGRSGPGQLYLASPYVVAASAVAGRLISLEDLLASW